MADARKIVEVSDLGEPPVLACPLDGTAMRRALVRYEASGQLFGYFPADICERGHDWLTEEAAQNVDAIAKARGLFGVRPAAPGERLL